MRDKANESVCALEVTDGGTSGLGTTFHKWRTIKSAGLQELYCV